jgi:hypothetical protein
MSDSGSSVRAGFVSSPQANSSGAVAQIPHAIHVQNGLAADSLKHAVKFVFSLTQVPVGRIDGAGKPNFDENWPTGFE